MTSYLPFSSSSIKLTAAPDSPSVEVIVTPSSSAYYAGDVFSAAIKFRNVKAETRLRGGSKASSRLDLNAEAGPSRPKRLYQVGRGIASRAVKVAPPALPTRRSRENVIPKDHPHARQTSVVNASVSPLPRSREVSPGLDSIPEGPGPPRLSVSPGSRSGSQTPASSTSVTRTSSGRISPRLSSLSGRRSPSLSSPFASTRAPSYSNAYGAAYLSPPPPPMHPSMRPVDSGITILWAYTRVVGHFHPSNAYIPPDPLLPLRSLMLHQPVGSGSLASPNGIKASPSRWQLSFGTGAIGHSKQPSLTGSLVGLAKELVYGGDGGSLQEERKRVWNMKDLPVLQTGRSLIGVDIKLDEGDSRSCGWVR